MEPIHISQTLSISNHRVFSADLNEHDTVFGGKILATIDDNSSIAASRVARIETVTVSVDQVNFLLPFRLQDSMCAESYVSGVGHRSIEVFTKIIGETIAMSGDNDCTGATAGSIAGAVIGIDNIPENWTRPFNGRMHIYLKELPEYLDIEEVCDRFEVLAKKLVME